VLAIVDFAGEEFPIPGEEAMKWLDYSEKGSFKRFYMKHLVEDADFEVLDRPVKNLLGGRPTDDVRFTVDGFKDLRLQVSLRADQALRWRTSGGLGLPAAERAGLKEHAPSCINTR